MLNLRRNRRLDDHEVSRWGALRPWVDGDAVDDLPHPHHEADFLELLDHDLAEGDLSDLFDPAAGPVESRVIDFEEFKRRALMGQLVPEEEELDG